MKKNNLIINCITYKFNNKDAEQKKYIVWMNLNLLKFQNNVVKNFGIIFVIKT